MEHTPVLTQEVIKFLAPHKNENFIDATVGLGGHAKLILERNAPKGRLLAIDQDEIALNQTQKNLKKFSPRVDFTLKNFSELGLIIRCWEVKEIRGILFDLGASTYQLLAPERGFSFNSDSTLDMRMSPATQRVSAREIVNCYTEEKIRDILRRFGEEPFARKIAREIVKSRKIRPISKTGELVEIIKRATPPKYRLRRRHHFATSTFRALRMAVNNELEVLESGLKQAVQVLSCGGRLVVISFHSLEDKIVKNFFLNNPNLTILTPKPVTATAEEIEANPKARSAKLRAAIKIRV